jgi:hypothetical protein
MDAMIVVTARNFVRIRRWPVGLAVMLTGAMAAVLLLSACTGSDSPAGATSHIASSPSPHPLPPARQAAIAAALSATQSASVAPVLPRPVASAYLASPFPMLPAGSKLKIDWSKLRISGVLAQAPASVSGPQRGSWILLLIWQNGQWDVYGTRKAAS